jgi:hypothetical protein
VTRYKNGFLILGGVLSAIAAMLHLACIVFGAPLYRFFGAGEEMAQMALAGDWYPAVAAVLMAAVLSVWSLYALSGAGVVRKLPLLRPALCAITVVYLLRGIFFVPLMPYFPGNSMTFWMWSSAICFSFGIVHLIGLKQVWSYL